MACGSDTATTQIQTTSRDSPPKLLHPPPHTPHPHHPHNRFSFATCVDSFKEGLRKIGGHHKEGGGRGGGERGGAEKARRVGVVGATHPLEIQQQPVNHGGHVIGVRRKKRGEREGGGRRSCFEHYLSSLPRLDPVDRTVSWVYQHPDDSEDSRRDSLANLPPRGFLIPARLPHYSKRGVANSRGSTPHYTTTSLSECESKRGTHGRGTPPAMGAGQPRLDELFRQLQLKQEREARRRLTRQAPPLLASSNLTNVPALQVPGYPPGITPELLPFLPRSGSNRLPHSIIHKNSSYYNQGQAPESAVNRTPPVVVATANELCCEWAGCGARLPSADLLCQHVEDDHIARLPLRGDWAPKRGRGTLVCRWRGCVSGCGFAARYKLLLHFKKHHCGGREEEVTFVEPGETTPLQPEPTAVAKRPTNHRARRTTDRHNTGLRKLPTSITNLTIEAHPLTSIKRRQHLTSHKEHEMRTRRIEQLPPSNQSPLPVQFSRNKRSPNFNAERSRYI